MNLGVVIIILALLAMAVLEIKVIQRLMDWGHPTWILIMVAMHLSLTMLLVFIGWLASNAFPIGGH